MHAWTADCTVHCSAFLQYTPVHVQFVAVHGVKKCVEYSAIKLCRELVSSIYTELYCTVAQHIPGQGSNIKYCNQVYYIM